MTSLSAAVPRFPSALAAAISAPVFTASLSESAVSHIANELGWLAEELADVGADPIQTRFPLQLAEGGGHGGSRLFREGTLQTLAQSRLRVSETRLLAVGTFSHGGGQVLVRADSNLYNVTDLVGRRIGLLDAEESDASLSRIATEAGILLALSLAGVNRDSVTFLDIVSLPEPAPWTGQKVAADLLALLEGRVDAIFTRVGEAATLESSGHVRVLQDLGHHPDWTLPINRTPVLLTASLDLIENDPEIVTAYLRACLRAGAWINANRRAAAGMIFTETARYGRISELAEALAGHDFVPNLSQGRLAEVVEAKDFLLRHGYLRRDFDLQGWLEPSFLSAAAASL